MSWLRGALDWFRRGGRRNITLEDFKQLGLLMPPVAAGVTVTPYSAMNYSAYFNAVDIISGQVAALPRVLYRRLENDEREKATNHPVFRLLASEPNPYMTPITFWQTLMNHALTWGNGYAEIEFDRALRPIALWPILPEQLEPTAEKIVATDGRVSYRLGYLYKGTRPVDYEDVFHLPGLGFDGIKGYSVATHARQTIGLAIAAERFGSSFFGNGAVPGVVLQHPKTLSEGAHQRLKQSWREEHGGANQLGVAITEEGIKVEKIGIPPEDAQFLETREFGVLEMARWFNLPPHKLKHKVGERPGGNIEASQIEFLTDTLWPWLVRLEQECARKLIAPAQRGTLYVEHLTNALLRTDAATRVVIQRAYWDMGVIDAAQIAKQENLPAPTVKVAPAAAASAPKPEPDDDDDEGDDEGAARMARAQRAMYLDLAARFVRREAAAVRRAAKRGAEPLEAWAGEFYGREEDFLAGFLEPAVGLALATAGSKADAAGVSRRLAGVYVARSRAALKALRPFSGRELEAQAERLMDRWESARAAELADEIAGAGEEGKANAA